ncbi:MAG: hypothetical protein HY240_07650 [Actinobacteria bacterium]|nr:hypothetical protein [Actinomycetota bacterium]
MVDEVPGEPREHMDVLLSFLLPFAQQSLDRYGGFYPFAASMAPDGELQAIGGYEGDGEPTPSEMLGLIQHGLHERAKEGALLVTAVCVDVTLPGEGEFRLGIRVDLEHRDSEPITYVVPYRSTEDGFEYGEMLSYAGEPHTFE